MEARNRRPGPPQAAATASAAAQKRTRGHREDAARTFLFAQPGFVMQIRTLISGDGRFAFIRVLRAAGDEADTKVIEILERERRALAEIKQSASVKIRVEPEATATRPFCIALLPCCCGNEMSPTPSFTYLRTISSVRSTSHRSQSGFRGGRAGNRRRGVSIFASMEDSSLCAATITLSSGVSFSGWFDVHSRLSCAARANLPRAIADSRRRRRRLSRDKSRREGSPF